MALTEGERVRYARQLLLAELSSEAHERLFSSHIHVDEGADPIARTTLCDYAARAGLASRAHGAEPVDGQELAVALPTEPELRALSGNQARYPALAALAGALAATEAVLVLAPVTSSAEPTSASRHSRLMAQLSLVSEDV